MGLSDQALRDINRYIALASGVVAVGCLFYFKIWSWWWWAGIADLVLFGYKMAAKIDVALMSSKQALAPCSKGPWQAWFAWYPVQVDLWTAPVRFRLPGDWVFLLRVKRRWARNEAGTGFETHYAYPIVPVPPVEPRP